jgi:hypothetical protein
MILGEGIHVTYRRRRYRGDENYFSESKEERKAWGT